MPQTIAIFSAQYLPHMGGVEVFTAELAKRLANDGHRVVVVAAELAGQSSYEKDRHGFEVYRLPSRELLGGRFPFPKRGEYRRTLVQLAAIPFDGVLINTRFYPHSLAGAWFADKLGIPAVVLDHGSDFVTFGNAFLDPAVRAYERVMTGALKRHCPRFYGISEASCQWLRSLGVEPSGVIPNAIDAREFRSLSSGRSFRKELGVGADVPLVTFTGRLIPEKGVRAIVGAATHLEEASVPCRFVLAGEGPLQDELLQAAPRNLSLVGRLDQPDVSALLQESDAFVFPSRSEGFGSSLLEAAVCGNALISTKTGISPQLIGRNEGGAYLSEPTAECLEKALTQLLLNKANLMEKGAIARSNGESLFSWENTLAAVLDALQ